MKMITQFSKSAGIVTILFATSLAAALELPVPFSNGMVLQRDCKVPVWGSATAGDEVTVSFAGQDHSARADGTGKWIVHLDPMPASAKSRELSIKAGGVNKTIQDVVVGEVWLCSGQSNMAFTLSKLNGKPRDPTYQPIVDAINRDLERDTDPLLRRFLNNAWKSSSPQENAGASGTAYYFARELRNKLNVPVGVMVSASSGTRIQPWLSKEAYEQHDALRPLYLKTQAEYEKAIREFSPAHNNAIRAKMRGVKDRKEQDKLRRQLQRDPRTDRKRPTILFESKIAPLAPFAIKGAIWYQGESNTNYLPDEYSAYLSALIKDWRQAWDQGDFPFYYAQLANFRAPHEDPVENDTWATVCNQQRLCLTLPNTGMAVLNDIGEEKDVHPKNKIDVGKRLALWALANDYGRSDLVCSGPLYKTASFVENTVTVAFDSIGSGLMVARKHNLDPAKPVNEPLQGFQICGPDRQWKWAKAKISSPSTVDVWHDDVSKPVEVRYAWGSNPVNANLYNKNGLPTSVFKATANK